MASKFRSFMFGFGLDAMLPGRLKMLPAFTEVVEISMKTISPLPSVGARICST
jgi:hypothetical protein